MIIDKTRLYRYDIALERPLRISSRLLTERSGLILVLTDNQGCTGLGEIAPLPGLHTENISDCVNQLRHLKGNGQLLRFAQSGPPDAPDTRRLPPDIFPTVAFGLQSALLNLAACRRGKTVRALLSENPLNRIPVSALITAEDDNRSFTGSGYKTFKIKTGRRDPQKEIQWIISLSRNLPAGTRLRLDANCGWDLDTALTVCHALRNLPIEYLEEPLQDHRQLPLLAEKTAVPIALDEHLPLFLSSEIPDWVGAIVIKPTVFPGIERLTALHRSGKPVVLSDTFQSGVGILMLAELAAVLGQEEVAMGFDTLNWLSEDILTRPPRIEQGTVCLSGKPLTVNDLNQTLLAEIGW